MTKKELDILLTDCGLKNYADLANLLDISSQTITVWNRNENYPKYLKQGLEWYKASKKYDEFLTNTANYEKNKIQALKKENEILEKELENLKTLKNIMKEKIQELKRKAG